MEEKNQNPTVMYGNHTFTIDLTRRQRAVYHLLKSGKYSAAEISIHLGYSDPRSYIKRLIDKGVCIESEWVRKNDTQFKRYFIEK